MVDMEYGKESYDIRFLLGQKDAESQISLWISFSAFYETRWMFKLLNLFQIDYNFGVPSNSNEILTLVSSSTVPHF